MRPLIQSRQKGFFGLLFQLPAVLFSQTLFTGFEHDWCGVGLLSRAGVEMVAFGEIVFLNACFGLLAYLSAS